MFLSSVTQNQLTQNNFQTDQFSGDHSSFDSLIESVDVRGALQSSRGQSVGVPLPLFTSNQQVPDQLLSETAEVPQSQVQVIDNSVQSQSNLQISGGADAGSASILPATLLGSTVGEMVSPAAVGFRVSDISVEEDEFQEIPGQSFELEDSQDTIRLDNLGQSTFVGSSQGSPVSGGVSVTNPQIVGVSLPQQVSVSDPRPLDQPLQQGFIRSSRSQTSKTSGQTSSKAQNKVVSSEKRLQSLEKMLQGSFGPDVTKEQLLQAAKSLVKTADMSKIPLEKHTKTSSSVFPPFSSSDSEEQTLIQRAVLK